MKLDVNVLRYLSKDDFRVLTAVEMGMRNVCISQIKTNELDMHFTCREIRGSNLKFTVFAARNCTR